MLTPDEKNAVIETLDEEWQALQREASESGVPYEDTRGPLLESAIEKLEAE